MSNVTDPVFYYRRPAILAEIPLDDHAAIEASAGTGKTYTIEHLVVELLLERQLSLENILVLTFTEKAAGELLQRVRRIIETILNKRSLTPPSDGASYWILDANKIHKLEQTLLQFDQASIATIHGFFHSLLQTHSFHSGRLFRQELVDQRSLFHEVFRTTVRTHFAKQPGLRAYLEPWLTVHKGNVDSLEELLFACHSRKARILPVFEPQKLLQLLDHKPDISDAGIDKLCTYLRDRKMNANTVKAIKGKLASLAALLRSPEQLELPTLLAHLGSVDTDYLKEKLDGDHDNDAACWWLQFLQLIVDFKAAIVLQFLPIVQKELEAKKRANGNGDFDDMIDEVWNTLDCESGKLLLPQLRHQYQVALVDEFQDTDDKQWRIFQRIFLASSKQNLLYVIGDPKQSIYSFRGADVNAYLRARQAITQQSTRNRVVMLRDNYRSTQTLIDAYNLLFDQNAPVPFFDGGIEYSQPVRCAAKHYALSDSREVPLPGCVVWELNTNDQKPSAFTIKETFAQRIADEIYDILNNPAREMKIRESADKYRAIQASDIFVLTVTNNEGVFLAEFLRRRGIAYSFYKQEGLFQSTEASDIRDLLAAVIDPRDRSKQFKAWLTPFFALSLAELKDAADVPETSPLKQLLGEWHQLAIDRDFDEMFHSILSRSGIKRREIALGDSERSLTNYCHLFDLLLEETSQQSHDLESLLAKLSRLIEEQERPGNESGGQYRLESERDAVQIMTMHKSKGLEAPVVFLYGGYYSSAFNADIHAYHDGSGERCIHIGKNWEVSASEKLESRQENQRLLYVAVTRAKFRLYLPFVAEGIAAKTVDGTYQPLMRRLESLRGENYDNSLFDWQQVEAITTAPTAEPTPSAESAEWTMDGEIPVNVDLHTNMKQLRWKHRPFTITSYTKMQRRVQVEQDKQADRADFETDAPAPRSLLRENELPPGSRTGTFLHEILELADPLSFRVNSYEEWITVTGNSELLRRSALRNDMDLKFLEAAGRMVFRAMTHPIRLGDTNATTQINGLCESSRILRELEFLFPYPEAYHPRLVDEDARIRVVDQGYVIGFVDVVFEHEEKVYFLDWKSNLLASYDYTSLYREVKHSYDLQIRLYSIAMMKLLDIHNGETYDHRFGGVVYCFLRGLDDDNNSQAGIYFHRPLWQDVLDFEAKLVGQKI